MPKAIEVRFLSGDEMENAKNIDARYEHVSSDNCGFADVEKGKIFVRAGLSDELTKYLISHELEHLYELEGTHEDEYGIRHKGGFWKAVVPILGAVLGGLLGGPVGAGLGGGLLGTSLGVGAGTMLGGTAGSSIVGKPNWAQNAIGGATAGVTSGLGSLGSYASGFSPVTGVTDAGSKITVSGARDIGNRWSDFMSSGVGQLSGQAAGSLNKTGLGMISPPSSYGNMFRGLESATGYSGNVPLVNSINQGFGMPGASGPSGLGSGGQGGGLGIQNYGTGQGGIGLAGKSALGQEIPDNYEMMFKSPMNNLGSIKI